MKDKALLEQNNSPNPTFPNRILSKPPKPKKSVESVKIGVISDSDIPL